MIQKGIVKELLPNENRIVVRVPIYETAGSEEALFTCTYSIQPGVVNGYNVDDVVYVDFENNQLEEPIVVGKLYVGVDDAQNSKSSFIGGSLQINGNANLPTNTNIGDISYYDLLSLKKRLKLEEDGDLGITVNDSDVLLSRDLVTNYNIGNITGASGENPVTIAHVGDSIRDAFDNIFVMKEDLPVITDPSITNLSFTSSLDNERGTVHPANSNINFRLTTYEGNYSYGPSPTGVSWTDFSFSGGSTTSGKTNPSGTIQLADSYTVGTTVTISVTGTHTEGLYAKTNLGKVTHSRIEAGTKSATSTFRIDPVDYPYYVYSQSTTAPTSALTTTRGSTNLIDSSGQDLSAVAGCYLWIISPVSKNNKNIEIYSSVTRTWETYLGGTTNGQQVTFTKSNGTIATFYVYRTINTQAVSAQNTIRLN